MQSRFQTLASIEYQRLLAGPSTERWSKPPRAVEESEGSSWDNVTDTAVSREVTQASQSYRYLLLRLSQWDFLKMDDALKSSFYNLVSNATVGPHIPGEVTSHNIAGAVVPTNELDAFDA
eukprot:gene27350-4649_t